MADKSAGLEPKNWRFTCKYRDVKNFHSRWVRSNYMLTITGSYERDELEYGEFWDNVYLYDALYAIQEEDVKPKTPPGAPKPWSPDGG